MATVFFFFFFFFLFFSRVVGGEKPKLAPSSGESHRQEYGISRGNLGIT